MNKDKHLDEDDDWRKITCEELNINRLFLRIDELLSSLSPLIVEPLIN